MVEYGGMLVKSVVILGTEKSELGGKG